MLASCAVLATGGLALVAAAAWSVVRSSDPGPAAASAPPLSLPPPAGDRETSHTPAIVVPEPTELDDGAVTARWASVERPVTLRAMPSWSSGSLGTLPHRTPEDTANIVLLARSAVDGAGTPWVQVRFSGGVGWIPQQMLGPGGLSRSRLVVDRSRRTISFYTSGRLVLRAPIGIGRPETPTPAGTFYVRNRLTRFAGAFYGPLAFGTSARARVSDWPGGAFVGIHGTNRPDLLPGAVSHGCIRMINADILRLGGLLEVGTPLEIV